MLSRPHPLPLERVWLRQTRYSYVMVILIIAKECMHYARRNDNYLYEDIIIIVPQVNSYPK